MLSSRASVAGASMKWGKLSVLIVGLTALGAFREAHADGLELHDIQLTLPETAGAPTAQSRWDDILNKPANAGVTFGLNLHGPSPYARNGGAAFLPASNSKLFTAGAALDKLGPDATFTTTLEWREIIGHAGAITGLVVRGSGDPTWGSTTYGETLTSRVDAFADALWKRGVRAVHGPIEVKGDDPRWNDLHYSKGWAEWARNECGTAQAQAVNVALNCASYVVTSASDGYWKQPGVPVPVRLKIAPGKRTELNVDAEGGDAGRPGTGFVVTGTFLAGGKAHALALPIADSAGWARNLLKQALRRKGIHLYVTPLATAAPVRSFTHESVKLSEIFKPFLKHSINVVGEILFHALGKRFGPAQDSLVAAGETVLREYVAGVGSRAATAAGLTPQPGFYSKDAELFDGSGISKASHVTTEAMMALLLDLRAHPKFDAIWQALPIAGVDGTLETRMRGTAAEGVLRAKTGTLDGVYNLSGYVPRVDGAAKPDDFVPFVMLTRTTSENEARARAVENQLGAELARLVRAGAIF
ncbi:MAG: D-alanyl-D-alanine carboxypeptidase/D-alanyl-D-alanine-endopeptidase [Deltaproteobacteria bacterium]|nr:D-alanyl-D-alanine carboxypeptidase/D-alanyl-D-alanine-endopeptidase [Deltaproteobacteria bacterium]